MNENRLINKILESFEESHPASVDQIFFIYNKNNKTLRKKSLNEELASDEILYKFYKNNGSTFLEEI